ncbi:MAG: hypothetical protein NT154_26400 [Verrucomicrobia bacterium]|nr:hypothetical protein [Verrucomicrobiota bacterium]
MHPQLTVNSRSPNHSPWSSLETLPGLVALPGVWRARLGQRFDRVKALILKDHPNPAQLLPCPRGCGLAHEIVCRGDGSLVATCWGDPARPHEIPLTLAEIMPLEVSWSKLGHALERAFGLQRRFRVLQPPNTVQFGAWSADAVPAVLTIQAYPSAFRRVVSELVAELGRPFMLFAPTSNHLDLPSLGYLTGVRAGFFPLDSTVLLNGDGPLCPVKAPDELFAQFTPHSKPADGEVAFAAMATGSRSKQFSTRQPDPLCATASSPPKVEMTDPFRYSLRRECACWVLCFKDGQAYLKHEIGLECAACLLAQPDKSVPSATLFCKFSAGHRKNLVAAELPDPETGLPIPLNDGVGIGQLPPDNEEAEAQRRYRAQLREYQETFTDRSIPEPEREEARGLYDELLAFLKQYYRAEPDPGGAVSRVVHRSIQRLCTNLRKPAAGQKVASPAALAFAEYIGRHILLPSRRYTRAKAGANGRVARGELAGRLIFECPPGHCWSVEM